MKLKKHPNSTGRPHIRADYDFPKVLNPAGGRKRRPPRIEKQDEEGILTQWHRLQGVNLSRDMYRNSAQVHGMVRGLRVHGIGTEGKLRFYRTGKWYAQAQAWFKRWAKHADYIDGTTWREMEQLAVYALENEGDFLAVFDDGILSGDEGTGRIATWETDQIVNLTEADFLEYANAGYTQENGIVKNKDGRVCGVIVSSLRGEQAVPADKALTFIFDTPEEFEASPVRLVARKFRLRQTRGVADAIPSLQLVTDCYELMGYELQGAKQQASLSAVVIDPPEGTGNTVPTGYADEPEDEGAEGEGDGENADDGPDPEEQEVEQELDAARASALEDLSGGNVDYLENGADVKFLPNNRPASQLPAFLDFANDMAGAAFGLNHSYSRNKADGSFTAFRGDLAMTWASLDDLRQFLEDKFFDWVAKRAINWAVENGELDAPTDEDWADAIAWTYPRMISVDPEKEAKAIEAKIRAGLTTYRQELGPDWLNQLQEISEERKLMHSLGLRHPQDETTAGAPVEPKPAEEENSND